MVQSTSEREPQGAPQALKVADRWHLLENATAAFVESVKRRMGDLRRAIAGDGVDPEALDAAEKKQWAGWQRRDEVNGTVRSLHGQGQSIMCIVRTTGVSRQTVRRILAGTRDDVFRSRETTLDRWAERLSVEWDGGCRNGAELWRRLRKAGYGGSQRLVTEWATQKRRTIEAPPEKPGVLTTVPPARTIAGLLTRERDCRSAESLRVRVAVETASLEIAAARNFLDRFRIRVAAQKTDDLTPWLRDAVASELASFASGVGEDEAAVRAAIVEPWSNGQTEGQVTRLKLVKRQMYGRANVDLLRARMGPGRVKGPADHHQNRVIANFRRRLTARLNDTALPWVWQRRTCVIAREPPPGASRSFHDGFDQIGRVRRPERGEARRPLMLCPVTPEHVITHTCAT